MFAVAECKLARERELLGHVGVEVLAALGDDAIERPERGVAQENRKRRVLAPGGVGKRVG